MTRPLLVVGCLLLAALPVSAQGQKWEAFGGYQLTHFQTPYGFSGPSKTNGNGWDAALGYSINDRLGLKADFSGSYGKGGTQLGVSNGPANLYTYTFGPTFSAPASPNVRLFAEFLAGGYHDWVQYFSNSPLGGVALMAGGGVDAQVRRHLAVRVFDVDWIGFMSGSSLGTSGSKSNFRFSAGLVIRF